MLSGGWKLRAGGTEYGAGPGTCQGGGLPKPPGPTLCEPCKHTLCPGQVCRKPGTFPKGATTGHGQYRSEAQCAAQPNQEQYVYGAAQKSGTLYRRILRIRPAVREQGIPEHPLPNGGQIRNREKRNADRGPEKTKHTLYVAWDHRRPDPADRLGLCLFALPSGGQQTKVGRKRGPTNGTGTTSGGRTGDPGRGDRGTHPFGQGPARWIGQHVVPGQIQPATGQGGCRP